MMTAQVKSLSLYETCEREVGQGERPFCERAIYVSYLSSPVSAFQVAIAEQPNMQNPSPELASSSCTHGHAYQARIR